MAGYDEKKGKHISENPRGLGEKLKNETTSREAMRKKLRTGKKDNQLTKEEVKQASKIREQGRKAYRAMASIEYFEKNFSNNEDTNVSEDTCNAGLTVLSDADYKIKKAAYSSKLYEKDHQRHIKEEDFLKKEGSNLKSKELQKKKLKRELVKAAQAKKSKETWNGVKKVGGEITNKAEYLERKLVGGIKKHPYLTVVILFIIFMVVILSAFLSSCTVMLGGITNATIQTSYTAEDSTIIAVDKDYVELEKKLQEKINQIETTHPGYDEYQYELVEINHNPYQLAAILTILFEDYQRAEVQETLKELFKAQYKLSYEEIIETRTKTEMQNGNEVEVEYEYKILKTTLQNKTMDTVIREYGLSEDDMKRYELLKETYGNKKYLFEDNIYSIVDPGMFQDYEIPSEYLTNEEFGKMIKEAEKYLGYQYVWGGSSPETGFDCSGFVSYVLNNCGNGWDVGRQTANGLLSNCSKVSSGDAKPGDLVFFKGTYGVKGASHVGIYVGDGMMLHCGNPIQYTDINSNYWKEHFYTYGRIN